MSSHAGSGQSLHKKTSNLSSGTEASISKKGQGQGDTASLSSRTSRKRAGLGSGQHPECSPSDGNYSPQTPSRSATSSLRRLAAPPSSFSPKGIHTSNLDPPREQGRTQDIFDDANLVTSTDIKREIAAIEAEGRRSNNIGKAAEETLPSHPSLPSLPSLDSLDSLQLNNKELVPSFVPPPPALPPSSSSVSLSVSSTFSGSTLTFSSPLIPLPLTVTTSDGGSAPHLEDPLVAPRAQKVDPEIPANMAHNLDETLRGVSPPVPVSLNNPGGFNIPSPQPPLQASLPDPNPTPNPNLHRSYYGGSMLVTDNNNIHKESLSSTIPSPTDDPALKVSWSRDVLFLIERAHALASGSPPGEPINGPVLITGKLLLDLANIAIPFVLQIASLPNPSPSNPYIA
ncbi:hypothetical protein GG344DRAFT_68826 [Lentinula edodes]|nr:hypothetical protein GG344DRAFT_68826 [Lentinula edodes]